MKTSIRSQDRSRAVRVDPAQLRAIIDLERLGYTRAEVCAALQISQATYYRRRTEIDLTSRPDAGRADP
jgi:hypothetical protein